jgi:hypothetical protein
LPIKALQKKETEFKVEAKEKVKLKYEVLG